MTKNKSAKRKVIGVGINGVLRDFNSQFDKWYRRAFIKNDSLVDMNVDKNGNCSYVPSTEETDEEKNYIEKIIDEKINFPIDTYDLTNHYKFDSKEDFNKFLYDDYPFQIFGAASQYPKAMEVLDRMRGYGEYNDLFDIVILSDEKDKCISSTYHFLAKAGCRIKSIRFVDEEREKWDYCDILIDESPNISKYKPKGKVFVKVSHLYNTNTPSDYSVASIKEVYSEKFLEKIIS